MKKLFSIKCVGTHGGAGMAEYIGQTAIENGWDSYIAYARNILPTKSHFIQIGSKWDIYEHILETRLFDNHGFASRSATRDLINKIDEIKPDIIHLHNLHGYYINIEILFNFLDSANIPIVWTMHDCWMFTGHCAHFVDANCSKWKSHCEKCQNSKRYPESWFIDRSFSMFEKKRELFNKPRRMVLVPVSKWIADFLPYTFMSKYPVKLIYNGVDLQTFRPSKEEDVNLLKEKFKIKGKFIVLGVAHTWTDGKGWSDFLKMSSMVDDGVVFVMIGLSKKQIKGLPHNIIGIERTNDIKQMADFYTAADVLWNPTYADTFPTTNLEALACGTPCVVYETGGCPESVDENTGFVVPQGDIVASLDAFKEIMKRTSLNYRCECRNRAEKYFNKEVQFKEYIKLYNTLL